MHIHPIHHEFVEEMITKEIIKFGGPFTLKDGRKSSFYVNMREMISDTNLFENAIHAIGNLTTALFFEEEVLARQPVDRFLMGIPEAASEYAGAIAYSQSLPLLKRRVKQKAHGEPRPIEGRFSTGDQVVLIDDVIASAKSKTDEIELLSSHGLSTVGVSVLIDRQQGGGTELLSRGIELTSAFRISDIATFALDTCVISEAVYDKVLSELSSDEI